MKLGSASASAEGRGAEEKASQEDSNDSKLGNVSSDSSGGDPQQGRGKKQSAGPVKVDLSGDIRAAVVDILNANVLPQNAATRNTPTFHTGVAQNPMTQSSTTTTDPPLDNISALYSTLSLESIVNSSSVETKTDAQANTPKGKKKTKKKDIEKEKQEALREAVWSHRKAVSLARQFSLFKLQHSSE